MSYERLRNDALEWDAVQQTRLRMNNMFKAFDRMKRPYPEGMADVVMGELKERERIQLRTVEADMRDGEPWMRAVYEYVKGTAGFGPAVFCVIGLIPPLTAFPNPAKLWAYLGLAVVDGKAVKMPLPPPPNNPRGPAGMHFSRRIRAYAIQRVVDPIVKNTDSPYRPVYDQRRMHTVQTHPEWAEEKNKSGELTPGIHYHRDAMRYVAKRVWRDLWNVANGRQRSCVTQDAGAPLAAVVE